MERDNNSFQMQIKCIDLKNLASKKGDRTFTQDEAQCAISRMEVYLYSFFFSSNSFE